MQLENRKLALQLLESERKLRGGRAAGAGGGSSSGAPVGNDGGGAASERAHAAASRREAEMEEGSARHAGDVSARGRPGRGGAEKPYGREGESERTGGGGGETESHERVGGRGREKGMEGHARERKGSPPPFVGPKGAYKDGKNDRGRGGWVGAQDLAGEKDYVISKTGLWTRVGSVGRSRSSL